MEKNPIVVAPPQFLLDKESGLTHKERTAIDHLVEFWNLTTQIDGITQGELVVLAQQINAIQGFFALRIAARDYPDFWRE